MQMMTILIKNRSGDGSSTFNLPDLEGAFLRGKGTLSPKSQVKAWASLGPSKAANRIQPLQVTRLLQAVLSNKSDRIKAA